MESSADSGGPGRLAMCAPTASECKWLCPVTQRLTLQGWAPLWPHLREASGFSEVLFQPLHVLSFHIHPRELEVFEVFLGPVLK